MRHMQENDRYRKLSVICLLFYLHLSQIVSKLFPSKLCFMHQHAVVLQLCDYTKHVRTSSISAPGLLSIFTKLGTDGGEACPELTPQTLSY
jgi:hypothetical protein